MGAIRVSDRVKASVKEKADDELLTHYGLASAGVLTNLGVLLLGKAPERAKLGTAPMVQAIKYDERGSKVGKYVWDDYALSPIELIDAIWEEIPDFRESYELPDGMFRTKVPAFEEVVICQAETSGLADDVKQNLRMRLLVRDGSRAPRRLPSCDTPGSGHRLRSGPRRPGQARGDRRRNRGLGLIDDNDRCNHRSPSGRHRLRATRTSAADRS